MYRGSEGGITALSNKAGEMAQATEEKTADMTEAGNDYLKETCIEIKKKTDGDESDC
ncbi:MAG: hypothetical protein ACI9CE_002750 [Flavobacterium sp.]|jgi:hypothetical protein